MDIAKMFVHEIDMRTIWSWYRQEDDLDMVQTRGSSNSIVGSFYCLSSSLLHIFLLQTLCSVDHTMLFALTTI